MKKLKVKYDTYMNVVDIEQPRSTSTPRDIDHTTAYYYIAKRELTIPNTDYFDRFYNMTRDEFSNLSDAEQLKMIGVRSGKKMTITTDAKIKANKASRHAEMSLQAQYCTWLRTLPVVPKFIHHEREGKRSYVAQNLTQKLNSAGAMPDHEFLEPVGKYTGLLIEFKRPGENWLMADGITVKKQYAHQYANHVMLWTKGKVVYFCNDLEIAKQIWLQYSDGRNMRQRVYKFPVGFEHLKI